VLLVSRRRLRSSRPLSRTPLNVLHRPQGHTQLPGLATASITTDWDPADELYGYELPIVRDYTTAGARRG